MRLAAAAVLPPAGECHAYRLQRRDERIKALVDVVSELAIMDEPRKRLAGIISGLDIHYDLGDGHPLLGRRMPDLDLVTADGPLRVFELLHDAKPVLLNLGEPGGFDITPWADWVQLIDAEYVGLWELLPQAGPGRRCIPRLHRGDLRPVTLLWLVSAQRPSRSPLP
ncbi:MAG: hypothetical protein ACHQC8_04555 [Solirubrobacterales bacterium]